MTQDDRPAPSRKRRVASIAAQVVLILITAGLILAIWLPAIVGPSLDKQRRDQSPIRRWLR